MSAPAKVLWFLVIVLVVVGVTVMYRYQMPPFRPVVESPATTTPTSTSSTPTGSESINGASTSAAANNPALAQGQKLYEQNCVLCHGATGLGDTPAGQAMKATNLAGEVFKANTKKLPPKEYIVQVIQEGVPGTAMVSFKGQIPDEKDQQALADYIISLKQ